MKSTRAGVSAAALRIRGGGTNVYEMSTHPFIIKIWLEESAEEAGQATWRGYITHVSSGKRRYLQRLDDIIAFIVPYLEEMGVDIPRG